MAGCPECGSKKLAIKIPDKSLCLAELLTMFVKVAVVGGFIVALPARLLLFTEMFSKRKA